MMAAASPPRLFVSTALAPRARITLAEDQAHYLGRVMRLKAGDKVLVFNGRDGEWLAAVEATGKGRCVVAVERLVRGQTAEEGPWLAFAPVKKTATDFIVEKATELGVSRLLPVFTRRTNSSRLNRGRLRRHAEEAAEQCGRLTVPELDDVRALGDLVGAWPTDRRLLVLDETGGGRPIAQVLIEVRDAGRRAEPPCCFLSGPEGGFEAGELDALRNLDFVTAVGLGRRVLRAETAALAALSCWQALLGDDG